MSREISVNEILKYKESTLYRKELAREFLESFKKEFGVEVKKEKGKIILKNTGNFGQDIFKDSQTTESVLLDFRRGMEIFDRIGMRNMALVYMSVFCEIKNDIKNPSIKKRVETVLSFYIPRSTPLKLKGLTYFNNSCYQDSTFVATFLNPNNFITENILLKDLFESSKFDAQIQNEILNIVYFMRGYGKKQELTCSNFRNILARSKKYKEFSTEQQHDASEFMAAIFNIFKVEKLSLRTRIYYQKNDKWVQDKDNGSIRIVKTYPLIPVPAVVIQNKLLYKELKDLSLQDFLTNTEINEGATGPVLKEEIYEGDYIIMFVNRYEPYYEEIKGKVKQKYRKFKDKIQIPEFLNVTKDEKDVGKFLRLSSVVIRQGAPPHYGHYTALVRLTVFERKGWYFYDDLKNEIKYEGVDFTKVVSKYGLETIDGMFYYT